MWAWHTRAILSSLALSLSAAKRNSTQSCQPPRLITSSMAAGVRSLGGEVPVLHRGALGGGLALSGGVDAGVSAGVNAWACLAVWR